MRSYAAGRTMWNVRNLPLPKFAGGAPAPLLASPLIQHCKLKSRICRKQFRHFSEPLGERRGGEQRIVPLPQIVKGHIQKQGEKINRNRIGEYRVKNFSFESL